MLISRHDITAGLLGCAGYTLHGYYQGDDRDPGTAFELMRNIALYAGKVGK